MFSTQSNYVMNNWKDTHECEDQRDAKRLQKRVALTAESLAMMKTINKSLCELEMDDIDVLPGKKISAEKDFCPTRNPVTRTVSVACIKRAPTPS